MAGRPSGLSSALQPSEGLGLPPPPAPAPPAASGGYWAEGGPRASGCLRQHLFFGGSGPGSWTPRLVNEQDAQV